MDYCTGRNAGVVKLVYTPALGAGTARFGGSSPLSGTKKRRLKSWRFFVGVVE
jgi:hypothetical protein